MNKSRLQEICQKKAWRLPEYTVTKQGQDHNPRFEATVVVNGVSFQSRIAAKSSREAQNDAAELAYLHLTAPPVITAGSSNATANFDGNNDNRMILQSEASRDSNVNEPVPVGNNDEKFKDMQHFYKNILQNLAQKRNLGRPVYSCEIEGPPHASRFRCKVTIEEKTYESLEFFPTIKEAEHAAARVALSSLTPKAIEEVQEDSSLYKNLLQELTQKEGCLLPVYTTTRSGEAHASMFVSVVDVKGEVFTGHEAKTKKQAEFSAAKVAYTKFKESKSNKSSMDVTPAYHEPGVHAVSSSHLPAEQNLGTITDTMTNSSSTSEVNLQDDQVNVTCVNHLAVPFPQPEMMIPAHQSRPSSPILPDHHLMKEDISTSDIMPNHSATTDMVVDSIKQQVETSTVNCNRVVVLPRTPNMNFPAGSTVLPMSDDKWVAVKVQSEPNQ